MVYDAVRGYLQLAMGLSEVTRQKANDAAKAVAGQLGIQGEDALAGAGVAAGIAGQQVQTLAEDLLAAARSNRKLLTDLVRVEVDAVVNRLGITDQKQVDGVRATLAKLEEQLAGLMGIHRSPAEPATPKSKSSAGGARPLVSEPAKKTTAKTAAKKTAAKKTAKKAAAKKTTASATTKKTAAKKTTANKTAAKKTAAKKTAAKKTAAKKTAAKKTTAKKTTAKKTTAKKTTAKKTTATQAAAKRTAPETAPTTLTPPTAQAIPESTRDITPDITPERIPERIPEARPEPMPVEPVLELRPEDVEDSTMPDTTAEAPVIVLPTSGDGASLGWSPEQQ
jgi:DNA polymerase III gamma/tau subunit